MHKKYYKNLVLLLVIFLLLPISFFFVACRSKKKPEVRVFQDIVDYLKSNETTDTSEEGLYIYTFRVDTNNDNTKSSERKFIVVYDINKDCLYFIMNSTNLDFISQIKRLDNYSNHTCRILARYQHSTSNNIQTAYGALVELPATEYKNMQTTIPLPAFSQVTENIPEDVKTSFHAKLSVVLAEYFSDFNNFYVQKVKNNDMQYDGAIYQYFYLPILQGKNA